MSLCPLDGDWNQQKYAFLSQGYLEKFLDGDFLHRFCCSILDKENILLASFQSKLPFLPVLQNLGPGKTPREFLVCPVEKTD